MTIETFYERIDNVFDKLYNNYGFKEDIIKHKQDLLEIYEKENDYRCEYIYKNIKSKHFYIDENGCIKSK
jgi:lipopolysaccharide biosynthesis regulator YciM